MELNTFGGSLRFDFPIHETTLANGLRVVVSQDQVTPVVAVNLWYDVGSRHEGPGCTGLAHLFEHLMFEGSTNVAPGEHFRCVNEAGGYNNASTSFDRTNYFECVPVEHLDLMLWLEADRMGGLLDAVTQESLDKQRGIVKNERRQRYDNVPYGTVAERLYALLYPAGHPYHDLPIGSMEDLEAATLADVRAFFQRHYAPNNAVLTIVGHVNPPDVFERVAHWFGGIPRNDDVGAAPAVASSTGSAEGRQDDVEDNVPEEALLLGYELPAEGDASLPALAVGFAVLSAGRGSAFEREVVRPELAQRCSASLLRGAGVSTATIAAFAKNGRPLEPALAVVQAEMDRLTEAGPTEEELERAKAQLLRPWLERVADPSGRADELSRCATVFGDPARVFALHEEEMRVEADDVRKAFASAFDGVTPATVRCTPVAKAGVR